MFFPPFPIFSGAFTSSKASGGIPGREKMVHFDESAEGTKRIHFNIFNSIAKNIKFV